MLAILAAVLFAVAGILVLIHGHALVLALLAFGACALALSAAGFLPWTYRRAP